MRVIEEDRPGKGDRVSLKRTGEGGYIVHAFATYQFRGMSWFSSESAESCAQRTRSRRRRAKEKGPEICPGPKESRSYDDIALHLLSSWLACLRFGSSNPYIGLHLLSDDPLAYSRHDAYPTSAKAKHE